MRVQVAHGVAPIRRDGVGAIDGHLIVRVDGHEDDTCKEKNGRKGKEGREGKKGKMGE